MKKTKYFLVSVMALMLCLMCLMTTTFSWFTRPSDSGGILEWLNGESDLSYNAVDGKNISMATYELSEDGKSAAQTSVTSFSNTNGISKDHRKYYRTDITNSGDFDQSVSLYIQGLNVTQGDLHLGVNNPLKTYKGIGKSSVTTTMESGNKLRIYFQHKGKWGGETFVAFYTTTNDNPTNESTSVTLYYIGKDSSNTYNYYAELPANTKKVFFAKQFYYHDYERTNVIDLGNEKITQTQAKVVYLTDASTDGGYADHGISGVSGANILEYYKTITITKGGKFNAALVIDEQYKGSISYSATGSAISVSGSTITANAVGTATLKTKVTGSSYGDTMEVTTTVTVVDSADVGDTPIVTNYKVPAKKDGKNTTVSVYWYINNEGDEALKYTIDEVYLSL